MNTCPEAKQELSEYKQNFSTLLQDNESLKQQVAKFATEVEILRATTNSGLARSMNGQVSDAEPTMTGPMTYSPTDYRPGGEHRSPAHRLTVNETTGEKLLNVAATWDLIVSQLSNEGLKLDVQDIYERLKGRTLCDGQGPAIEESRVRQAIAESIAGGSDELI